MDREIPVSPAQEQLYAAIKGQVKPEVMEKLLKHMTEQINLQTELIDSIQNQTRKIEEGNVITKRGDSNLKGFLKEQEGMIGRFFRFTEARSKGEASIKDLFTKENVLTTAIRGLSLGATKFGLPGAAVFVGINKVLNDYQSYVKDKQAKREERQIELINTMSFQQGKSQEEIIKVLTDSGATERETQKLWQKHLDIQDETFRQILLESEQNGDTFETLQETLKRKLGMSYGTPETEAYMATAVTGGKRKGGKSAEEKQYAKEAAELRKQGFTEDLITRALGAAPKGGAPVSTGPIVESAMAAVSKKKYVMEGGTPEYWDKVVKQLRDSHNVLKTISDYEKNLLATQRHAVGLMDSQFKEKMEAEEDARKSKEESEGLSKEEGKKGGFLSSVLDIFKKGFMNSPLGKFIMGGMGTLTGVVTKLVGGLGGTIGSILGPAMAVIAVAGIGTLVGNWISKNVIGESTTGGEREKGVMSDVQMAIAKKRGYTGPMNEEAFNAWLKGGAKMSGAGAGAEIPSAVARLQDAQKAKEQKQTEVLQRITELQQASATATGGIPVSEQTQMIHKLKSNSDDVPLSYAAKVGAR